MCTCPAWGRPSPWPISSPLPSQPHLSLIFHPHLIAQITDAQHSTLAGLMKALGSETDGFAVEDDIEGEKETLVPVDTSKDSEGLSPPIEQVHTRRAYWEVGVAFVVVLPDDLGLELSL